MNQKAKYNHVANIEVNPDVNSNINLDVNRSGAVDPNMAESTQAGTGHEVLEGFVLVQSCILI